MYSKASRVALVAIALVGFFVGGCGIHLGEKTPPPGALTYNGAGYGCLAEIPQHLDSYFNDQLSEPDITEFIGCMQKSFISFGERTHGRDQDSYSPEEIRRFLETYFLRNYKVTDKLLHQFMVIKQLIVGGDIQHVSRNELSMIVDVLDDVRTEAIRLKPYIKYLNLSLLEKQGDNADLGPGVLEAEKALDEVIQVFSQHLQYGKHQYAFTDLQEFLVEFRTFVGWESAIKDTHPVPLWINLMKAHKQITVSPQSPDVILVEDWQTWMQAMSRWYLSVLEYRVGVQNHSILRGTGLQNATLLGQQIVALLEQAVERQPQKVVTFAQLSQLTAAIGDLQWLPAKASSVDKLLIAVVTKIFGDAGMKPSERVADGISLLTVVNMQDEFFRWVNLQKGLDSSCPAGAMPEHMPANLDPHLFVSQVNQAKPSSVQAPWDEFIRVTTLFDHPLFADGADRISLLPKDQTGAHGVDQGFYNMSMMNAFRAMTALVFRGYASNNSTLKFWGSSISSDELQNFYSDIRDFGIDIGFVDKNTFNAGSRAFIEGKLFTYVSTGLQFSKSGPQGSMSFVEATGYFATLFSGANTASDLYTQFLKTCANGAKDDLGVNKVDRACVRNTMPDLLIKSATNMPYLQDFLRKADANKRKEYVDALLGTIASPDPTWFSNDDMTTLTVILYYNETVMTRFDSSEDGILDGKEVEAAVPVFSGFVKKIAAEQMGFNLSDFEARGAFIYILNNKTLPGVWNVPSVWVNGYFQPTVAVDRVQLMQTFQSIVGKLMQIGAGQPTPATSAPK